MSMIVKIVEFEYPREKHDLVHKILVEEAIPAMRKIPALKMGIVMQSFSRDPVPKVVSTTLWESEEAFKEAWEKHSAFREDLKKKLDHKEMRVRYTNEALHYWQRSTGRLPISHTTRL